MASDLTALDPHSEQFQVLLTWIDSAHAGPISVLDVGGGGHFYDFPALLRGRARRIVGVDPDPGVLTRPWLDSSHQVVVEQYARETAERFEVALCVYVLEHVEHPAAFLAAVRSLLVPGGSCFGVTPNLWHYFGLASAVASRIGVESWLLHKLRPAGLVSAYHSPVRYRLNSIPKLRRTALRAGFKTVEVKALDQPGMFETYFPPWLRWWPRGYSRAVNRAGKAELFGTLIFRLSA